MANAIFNVAMFKVPKAGLTLPGTPFRNNTPASTTGQVTQKTTGQVMQVDLADVDPFRSARLARDGDKGSQVNFGKSPGLQLTSEDIFHKLIVARKTQPVRLFRNKNGRLVCDVGDVSHKLEVKKNEPVETDPALLALQSSLAEAKRKKESNTSIYDKDDSLLKIAKGTKRVIGKSNLLGKKNHRTGLFKNTTARSVSTSPSLGASRTPRQKPIMSISIPTDAKSQKEQAVKTPLFHLLAIRAVSKNWLVKETKCSSEECEAVLEKYGKPSRLDASKYDLSDRGFKELDIWSFPYKSDSERQGAIDHAISAFDRMRVPREEKIWQLLLPKAERNKGIFLSKLQLNNGSMQKVSTPLINVEQTDGARKEGSDDDQRGRLVPSDADSGARSEPIKRKKISEKEAQSKRLLSKNPKKATEAAKAKESKLAAKENKSSAKKETIKETSKSTAPSAAKVKSTEFVHESDEDVDMDDTLTIIDPDAKPKTKADSKQSQSTEKTKKTPAAVPKSKVSTSTMLQKSTSTRSIITAKKSTATTSSNSGSEQRITNGLPKPVPMQRNVSHSRNTSSPIKPSPLGSSPPTNASDLDNDGRPVHISSTHSSPFITSAPRVTEAAALKCVARKITHSGHDTTERQPTVERAKKRKVEDPDADSPAQSGGLVANGVQRPAKRHQASVPSPTLSDSSGSQSSPVLVEMVDLAKKFKTYYAQYEKLHRELSASPNPDNDQVERLLKMHNRLDVMKIDIKKGVAA